MGFYLKQYYKEAEDDENTYMTYIGATGVATTIQRDQTEDPYGGLFPNPCVKLNGATFSTAQTYYFHGKIYRLANPQEFTVKLANYENYRHSSVSNYANQYLRIYNINSFKSTDNVNDQQYDIEFIFTPIVDGYDTIVFELTRSTEDLDPSQTRVPIIGYEELSLINNSKAIIVDSAATSIVKLGIQARPSFIICLNGEGIRVPYSGIQELREGSVPIDFISLVAPAQEVVDTTTGKSAMDLQMEAVEKKVEGVGSNCFFNTTSYPKIRPMSAVAIDYLYTNEQKQQGSGG